MSVVSGVLELMDGVYLRIRHPGAHRVDEGGGLDDLRGHKYCLLVTYRRSGEAVPTPVWFGAAEGKLYVRSGASAAKLKRIRNDPHVRVAPCNVRGKPLGPAMEARAAIVPSAEEAKAEAALSSNYGLGRRVYEAPLGPLGVETAYIEIAPIGGPV
jgi:PPOX class probable F420-dependent enzyme